VWPKKIRKKGNHRYQPKVPYLGYFKELAFEHKREERVRHLS
jgi:hypothetical protein